MGGWEGATSEKEEKRGGFLIRGGHGTLVWILLLVSFAIRHYYPAASEYESDAFIKKHDWKCGVGYVMMTRCGASALS